jgi:hypothetical protein
MMRRSAFYVLILVTAVASLVSLVPTLLRNLLILSSGASGDELAGNGAIWYGAGVTSIADEQRADLLKWTLIHAAPEEKCTDRERHALDVFLGLPFHPSPANDTQRKPIALRARQTMCNGNPGDASAVWQNANEGRWLLQEVALSRAMRMSEQTTALTTPYICPSGAEWCRWCVAQMQQAFPGSMNGSSETTETISVDLLNPAVTFNITVTQHIPFVVGGVNPAPGSENYVEYPSKPVTGSEIIYRLKGLSLQGAVGCVYPRLVFWGKSGEYLGEMSPRYETQGRFDIIMTSPLPEKAAFVTPRVSFNHDCLPQPQGIALCSAALTIGQ